MQTKQTLPDEIDTINGYKPYTEHEIRDDISIVSPWFEENNWFYEITSNTFWKVINTDTTIYTVTLREAKCEHFSGKKRAITTNHTPKEKEITASELRGELEGGYLRGIPQGSTHKLGDTTVVNTGEYLFVYGSKDLIISESEIKPQPVNLRYESLHPSAYEYDLSVDDSPIGIYSTTGSVPSGDSLIADNTNNTDSQPSTTPITASYEQTQPDKQPTINGWQHHNSDTEFINLTPSNETGQHETLVGDCQEILTQIPPESIQLTVTSPPYNIDKDYGDYDDAKRISEWKQLLYNTLSEIFRATKPDGKCVINIGKSFSTTDNDRFRFYPLTAHIKQIAVSIGWDFWDEIIWKKDSYASRGGGALLGSYPHPTNFMITQNHEHILVFRKWVSDRYHNTRSLPSDDVKSKSALTKDRWRELTQSVWNISGVRQQQTETDHKAVYPEEIPKRLIQLYSFTDDYILDPFAGTGTTGVAAKKAGRNYIGIEQNEGFAATAESRIKEASYELDGYTAKRENQ